MYFIIIFHELGHIFFSYIFNYEIKKINIYPFGIYTIFIYDINNKFINELLLVSGGIIFQLILFLLVNTFNLSMYSYEIFYKYNISLLIFNLIPIIPLDGSKVFNIFINKVIPFKLSHILTYMVSYILVITMVLYFYKSLNIVMMSIILLSFTIKEHKNHLYLFNKFLLERYIKHYKFKSNNIINNLNINKMKKYKNNVFVSNNTYITEENILKTRFK